LKKILIKTTPTSWMADSVYFGDMMRTLHEILDELKTMNKKLDKLNDGK